MINEHLVKDSVQRLSQTIKQALPKDIGFFLYIYQSNPSNFMHYISNGQRKDTIQMLKQLLETLEEQDASQNDPN